MLKKSMFLNPNVDLEGQEKGRQEAPQVPDELCRSCPSCKKLCFLSDLQANCFVCPDCGHHFRLSARERIALIADAGSFAEINQDLTSTAGSTFPGYAQKLEGAMQKSGENEGVVTGFCQVGGHCCALFVMDSLFFMGSMGTAVGEKITLLFEAALAKKLPVLGYTVSGGARIQEGILSLMQMAKTSAAVKRHSQAGLFYLTVLTDPTTGGVTASFAMEGDIILAEPGALIGFAGPRVIEQTIRQKLPEGFQRSEFLIQKGFVDSIVDRRQQKQTISLLLGLHEGGAA